MLRHPQQAHHEGNQDDPAADAEKPADHAPGQPDPDQHRDRRLSLRVGCRGVFHRRSIWTAHCSRRPQPLAGCQPASRLPFVCYQCTLDLMSPQPGSRMSSLHSTLPLAVPSPGDARSRLLFPAKSTDGVPPQAICRRAAPSPSPLRDLCTTPPGSGRCRPRCRVSNCGRCPAPMPLPLLLPSPGGEGWGEGSSGQPPPGYAKVSLEGEGWGVGGCRPLHPGAGARVTQPRHPVQAADPRQNAPRGASRVF